MVIEMGNHTPVIPGPDDKPKVTYIHIPELDPEFRSGKVPEGVDPEDHDGRSGDHYSFGGLHDGVQIPPLSVVEFKTHRADALDYNQGITQMPGMEAALAVVNAWPARGRKKPAWVKVNPNPAITPSGQDTALEAFLSEYYECPTLQDYFRAGSLEDANVQKELNYWTKRGAPGEYLAQQLPTLENTYMVDGRIMNNNNDGGDALETVMMGTGTAATATTFTTASTLVTNAMTGHRIVVRTAAGTFVWGNCISNTNAAGASVITVDQWYVPLTPGGSAGSTPTGFDWMIVDGGMISTWFAALATGGNSPVNTDHTLATNGNAEYPTAAGGLYRKICPTATDVSSSARTVTLVPVWTANGSDTGLPRTFTVVGFFASMVPGFGGAGGPMKFETLLSPSSAVISASGDQLTVTETITGS